MKYTVKRGDCLTTIAEQYGFKKLDTIWDHPENSELKEKRKNRDILFEGDEIHIPDKDPKKHAAELCSVNKFKVPVKKTYLRLRLLNGGQPRVNEALDLKLVGHNETIQCTTDADGKIEEIIPDNLRVAIFRVGKNKHRCYLDFGHLNPVDKLSGARARLKNLHFHSHRISRNGAKDPYKIDREKRYIENSIKRFQFAFDKKETGEHDDKLKVILEDKHEKDQSWTCKPKEGEIPYKLPNRTKFFIAKNTWNTIDIVEGPDIILDGHMHIQSANCAPLPLSWNTVHRVALLIRFKRSVLQDKTSKGIGFVLRSFEKTADSLPDSSYNRLGPLVGPVAFAAGYSVRSASNFLSKKAGPLKDLIDVSNKNTSLIGDDVIEKHRVTFKEFRDEQPEDNLSSMIVMPMDMEYAHINGYHGKPIYTLVQDRYFLKIDYKEELDTEFIIEKAVGNKVTQVKEYTQKEIEAFIKDDDEYIKGKGESEYIMSEDKSLILLPPGIEWDKKIDRAHLRRETKKFYYTTYKYKYDQEGETYWMPDEEHALYETYESQIQHTLAAAVKYPFEMIPMYHYDPRRWKNNKKKPKKWKEPFENYFNKANEQLFVGLKMYTALGYKPWDEELWDHGQKDVYDKCAHDKIPILCHCTPEGMVTIDRPIYADKDLKTAEERNKAKTDYFVNMKKKDGIPKKEREKDEGLVETHGLLGGVINTVKAGLKLSPLGLIGSIAASNIDIEKEQLKDTPWKVHYFRENYVAPKTWAKVLEVYPDLRLCLAHFGGDQEGYANWNEPKIPDLWDEGIIKLIEKFDHVYTDISFFQIKKHKDKFKAALKKHPALLEKIMFGTDWFLIVSDGKEYQPYCEEAKEIIKEIEKELKDDSLWLRFTRINPMRFYRIKENADKLYNGWDTAFKLANEGRKKEEKLVTDMEKRTAVPIRDKNHKIIKKLRL